MQNEEEQRLEKIETLVRALDTQFRVPLLGVRFGWDALIGLIPGIGDGVSAMFSAYLLLEAAKLGAPKTTLFRMAGNTILDAVIGLVPIVGDLFDFAFRANKRNLDILLAVKRRVGLKPRSSRAALSEIRALLLLFIMIIMFLLLSPLVLLVTLLLR